MSGKVSGWEQFKRDEARPGRCLVCDHLLPARHRLLCPDQVCRSVAATIYQRGYWHTRRAA